MIRETIQRVEGALSESDDRRIEAARVGGFFLVCGGAASALVALVVQVSPLAGWRPLPLVAFSAGAAAGGVVLLALARRASWGAIYAINFISIAYVALGMLLATGSRSFGPVFFFWAVLWSFAFFPLGWAVASGVAAVAALAFVFTLQSGWPDPFTYWIFLSSTVGVTGWIVRGLVTRAERARAALAMLNHTLEDKVEEQVGQLQRLGRLRRFLSPQVAEAVLSEGDEALLQPHRRQIAVFFCDLRGFTTFTGGAEPEEVVEALDEYYRVVGDVLRRHDATVGTFAGDGIMAYLNDPVPCGDPAGTAVQMAIELREPMAVFIDTWKRRGYDLGYGIGIAYGYATLGTIGFEGRHDYTALGSVVNLAARLCGEAASGQVLVDSRTSVALSQRFQTLAREVTLKGFASPVAAVEVAG
ncbi:MAG: adenylate/guanylate cyclase domain-containing protein [Acidimicrobiia bacterium]|nr:adenylate/guanylate cyclase domain-containing protein [Acidimicrobiia bacterium]